MAKTAGVKDLKAKLSQYIREVKRGETVLVTEHGKVVAKLVPLREEQAHTKLERERQQLLASGLITRLGSQEQDDWPEPAPLDLSSEEYEAAFDAQRDDR